jgi:hypothetical protein
MTDRIIAALIIGASLIAAGFAAGGRYAIASSGNPFAIYVLDRHTGELWICGATGGCRPTKQSN